jgi:hypothetical protein
LKSPFREQTNSFLQVSRLQILFAVFFGALCFGFLANSHDYARNFRVEYLWPLFWAQWLERQTVVDALTVFGFTSFMLGIIFFRHRLPKILMGYGFLCQLNIAYTFGNVGHANHAVLWTFLLLALCPTYGSNPSRALRQRVSFNFFLLQLFVGFFYFLAGFTKLIGALTQLFSGQWSAFNGTGMSRILAERLIVGNTNTLWGGFFIENYALGFISFWISISFEMLSLLVVFLPRWHRPWAIGMISFHLIVALTLSPTFSNNLWLLGLLFLCSPFGEQGNKNWLKPTLKWLKSLLPMGSSKGIAPASSPR